MKKLFVYSLLLFDVVGLLMGLFVTVYSAYEDYIDYKEYSEEWSCPEPYHEDDVF